MKRIGFLFVVCALLLVSVSKALAADATYAEIYTSDSGGNKKINFDLGETVYIHYKIESGKTADIKVMFGADLDGGPWTDLSGEGVLTHDPSHGAGLYSVSCTGAETVIIAYGTFNVIPELPIGTVMATVAAFGALGSAMLKRRK